MRGGTKLSSLRSFQFLLKLQELKEMKRKLKEMKQKEEIIRATSWKQHTKNIQKTQVFFIFGAFEKKTQTAYFFEVFENFQIPDSSEFSSLNLVPYKEIDHYAVSKFIF